MDTNWRSLLSEALAEAGAGGKAKVAARLGVSRSYVSRVMNPNGKSGITDPSEQFIRRVNACLNSVICPATEQPINRRVCQSALEPAPSHNPIAVQRWKICQNCPRKPGRTV